MIINIKNWGAVKEISIDTGKPLVVMCGPNSTGKTYVSYLIYALFSKILRTTEYVISNVKLPIEEELRQELTSKHCFELKETQLSAILQATASSIKQRLVPLIFAISDDMAKKMFHDFDLEITLARDEYSRVISKAQTSMWKLGDRSVKMEKRADSAMISIDVTRVNEDINSDMIQIDRIPYLENLILAFLQELAFGDKGFSRMLTVERNSVYTFSKELALNRSFGIGDLIAIKHETASSVPERYPMAVTDSLKIAVDLQQIQKNQGYFYEYASMLERNLLNGDIEINEHGAVEFVPDSFSEIRRHLPIQMTSSIVKTMSSLIIYLKHIANKGDILIIDEPEMNLHPDNQRLLTCIFAELINRGLNVILSTHSDYIIRELNNLIMAHEIDSRKMRLEEDEHVPYTKHQMLDRRKIEVLYFDIDRHAGAVIGKELPVSEFGFDVESIDDAIITQNRISHNLADILKYGEPDE